MSPYQGALNFIERHPGTGSALRLAKLLLSLWNGEDCGFSVRECLEGLDDERQGIALGCVTWFAQHGETDELTRIGYRVLELYPRQWELGVAARDAKSALRASWEAQRERELREEDEALERAREAELLDEDPELPPSSRHDDDDDAGAMDSQGAQS